MHFCKGRIISQGRSVSSDDSGERSSPALLAVAGTRVLAQVHVWIHAFGTRLIAGVFQDLHFSEALGQNIENIHWNQ